MPSPIPARIGRYEIKDRLGAGGMGVIYLATDSVLRRTVAIKVLTAPDDDLRERFVREARSAAVLRHPNIVTVYDIGDDNGQPFIAMEFVDGESMAELVRRRAPLSIDRRLQLLVDLCAGLGYAHKSGIVHRDIKPANLMVSTEGALKILDFGLARIVDEAATSALTLVGSVLGTPHYMSPEQAEGKVVDARSDIFSVGVVLYELLSYQKAYPGDSAPMVLHNIVHISPTPIRQLMPSIDPALEAIVNTTLEKDPERRYQDLDSLAKDVARVRAGLAAGAESETIFIDESPVPRAAPSAAANRVDSAAQQRERELAGVRAASAQAAIERGRRRFDEGALDAALRSANEALAYEATNPEALSLRDRVAQAIADRGQHDDDGLALTGSSGAPASPRPASSARPVAPTDEATVQMSAAAIAKMVTPAPAPETTVPLPEPRVPVRHERVGINPRWMIAAAAAVLLIGVIAWWPRPAAPPPTPDDPPPVADETPVGAGYRDTIESARQRYQANDIDGAVSLALSVPESAPERSDAMQMLTTMRSDAAARTAAERQAATSSSSVDQQLILQGDQKIAEAAGVTEPVDTARAVALYEEASSLFRRAPTTERSADSLVADAQQQYASNRRDAAVDLAIEALKRTPDHGGALDLLQSIKGAAADAVVVAGRRARSAGLTEANSAGVKDARSREAAARALRAPADTRRALSLYDAALASYRAATRAPAPLAASPVTQTPAPLATPPSEVDAQQAVPDGARLAAEKAVREGLQKFESAFEARSVGQFVAIATYRAPGDIAQEFAAARSIRMDIGDVTIAVPAEGRAIVRCTIRTVREPAGGRGKPVTDSRPWQLTFADVRGGWRITAAAPQK